MEKGFCRNKHEMWNNWLKLLITSMEHITGGSKHNHHKQRKIFWTLLASFHLILIFISEKRHLSLSDHILTQLTKIELLEASFHLILNLYFWIFVRSYINTINKDRTFRSSRMGWKLERKSINHQKEKKWEERKLFSRNPHN